MFSILVLILLQRPATFMLQSSTTGAVTASWSANAPSDNVVVYRLYYGTASNIYTTTIDITAPLTSVVVPNLTTNTTYYFAIQARAATLFSALSPEVSITIPQANPCLDSGGNNVVQLRVLSFTSLLAANGLGQLLWTITSVARIVNITATLNGNPISVINGADSKTLDLARSAGVNFNAPSTSGAYTLVVSAVDINGCKADTSSITRIVNVP